ncbi:MAG: hypothetical protein WC933_02435 [Candidatus Paceibacterota bacterium]|jgi:hypothetical protein
MLVFYLEVNLNLKYFVQMGRREFCMSEVTDYKKVFKEMTKAQEKRWKGIEDEIKDRDADLVIREVSSGFLIAELFSSKGHLAYQVRLDEPPLGPGNFYLRNLLSGLEKYFKETTHRVL